MNLVDIHYRHWEGRHRGIWYRRGVIALAGLRACLSIKWMRHLVMLSWVAGLIMVAALFFMGQLLVADSLIVKWTGNLNPQLQTFARGFTQWLEENPQISVRVAENALFYFFSTTLLTFSLIAIAIAIPNLVTRDLGSNAILVYAAKAVNRFDYFFGKWLIVMGLLTLTWLGPLVMAWAVGNLLAPRWHFFWHSRIAIGNTLVFTVAGMAFLSLLALGVSSLTQRDKSAVGLWLGIWLLGNALVPLGNNTQPWLKFLSFRHDLSQLALGVFKIRSELELARDNVPVLGQMLQGMQTEAGAGWLKPELQGALWGLAALSLLSFIVLFRKVRPE